MTDTDRIAQLEGAIEALQSQQDHLHEEIVQLVLDQWRARIDDLEIQLHLGTMEAGEVVSPLLQVLRDRLLDARVQVDGATERTREVASTLVSGLEHAMADIRASLLEAKTSIARQAS